jgi:hypothetical protein
VAKQITQGTLEYLEVDVTDRTGSLTNLAAASPVFDVMDKAETVDYYDEEPAAQSGMTILCLLDTTEAHTVGLWPRGDYRLWVRFSALPEIPRLGPFEFEVI